MMFSGGAPASLFLTEKRRAGPRGTMEPWKGRQRKGGKTAIINRYFAYNGESAGSGKACSRDAGGKNAGPFIRMYAERPAAEWRSV